MITPADMSSGPHNTEQMLVMSKQWKTFKTLRQKHLKALGQKPLKTLEPKNFEKLKQKWTMCKSKNISKEVLDRQLTLIY